MNENAPQLQLPHVDNFIDQCVKIGKVGQGVRKLLEEINRYILAESPSSALGVIQDSIELLDQIAKMNPETYEEISKLKSELTNQSATYASNFEREFPNLVEAAGIQFCEGTVHPVYFIDRSFIEVKANTRSMNCLLRTRGGKEYKIGIEPKVVLAQIQNHLNRLHNREFNSQVMLERCVDVYNEILSKGGVLNGSVKLKDFIKTYQKNYRVSLDEALIDFSNAHKEIPQLSFDYVRDHCEGFQLYGFEEYGYFGFLRIEGN